MLTLQQIRVNDPVLTQLAVEFIHKPRIGDALFPYVDVGLHGGKTMEFDKSSFYKYRTRRAPGADVKVKDYGGYEGKPFTLEDHDLDALVPEEHIEEAANGPGIDLSARAVNDVMDAMTLELEDEQARMAQDPATYAPGNVLNLTGADKWSDPASDPQRDIKAAKETIRTQTGTYPNRLVLGITVFNVLQEHPKLLERIKYTQTAIIDRVLMATLLGVPEIVTGESVFADENNNDQFVDVWGNFATLAVVAGGPVQQRDRGVPSFGYTYRMRGHPRVEVGWYDRVKKSWRYGCELDRKPVVAAKAAGFLFRNPA
jgi:Phage major capsid protein E